MKKNTRSWAKDAIFLLVCVLGAGMSVYFFNDNLNRTFARIGAEPVAVITFKYRTAQRRIIERVLWDRLRQESPVYDGDTIRTSKLAEATIHFVDGNSVELTENTIIRVSVDEEGRGEIGLESGSLEVSSAAEGAGLALRSGASRLAMGPGSRLSATAVTGLGENDSSPSLVVRMREGSASDNGGAVYAEGAQAIFQADGTARAETAIVVTEPAQDARLLKRDARALPVSFRWSLQNADASTDLVLEASAKPDFSDAIVREVVTGRGDADLALPAGLWYWRLAAAGIPGADVPATATGRVNVLDAPLPRVIAPAAGYEYRYRSRSPAVRFLWTADGIATAWELTIADNETLNDPIISQRCTGPSSIVSKLGAGTWYWRVRPWYATGGIGYSGSSEVSSFAIAKSGALRAPELLRPAPDSLVDISSAAVKSARFSWKHEQEAASYAITISGDPDMKAPAASETASENMFALDPARAGLKEGRWYWTVTQTDVEGNVSPASAARAFIAARGELYQRAVFPPDGYTIAENLAADTRFTWKSNIPGATRLQISPTADFTETIRDVVSVSSLTHSGGLALGEHYWRVTASVAGADVSTSARKVVIAPPLAMPERAAPENGGLVVVRPTGENSFTWDPVEGASFYSFAILSAGEGAEPAGADADPVYENTAVDGHEVSLDLKRWKEGAYRWTVQAFAEETPSSTRRTGLIADQSFTLRLLKPVDLISPADGISIDGREAILRPGSVTWSSQKTPASYRFILTTDPRALNGLKPDGSALKGAIMNVNKPGKRIPLPRLEEGRYWWTIVASTADGLDISALSPRSFTVKPVPRLPAPSGAAPADGTVFGYEYLSKSRSARFSWNAVSGASHYRLTIRKATPRDSGKVLFETTLKGERLWTMDDLAVLDQGDFIWTVEALFLLDDGAALQRGELRPARFSIKLPTLNAPKGKSGGTLYGL